jgi:PAS domain S-box-containing protein
LRKKHADATKQEIRDTAAPEKPLKSGADYCAVFDALGDAVFVLETETAAIRQINQKMCEMYGYSAEEAVRMTWGDTSGGFPPYTAEDANCRIVKAAKEGPQLFEWLTRDRSGKLFWVEVSAKLAAIGRSSFIVATTRDIADRKQVERELTTTKDYLNTVFNNIHDAVFVHDVNGKVIDVNDTMLDMYQFSREEAIGLSIIPDYTTPEGRPDLPAIWKRVIAGEHQFLECRGRRPKDDYEFDVEVFLTKLPLPEGDSILATVRQISERKRVERELLATKHYLNTVFNSIHDAVFVHDRTGQVVDVNDKLLDMYKLTREEAIGLSIIPDYTAPVGRPDLPAIWNNVMNGRDELVECRGRRPKDGYEFDAETFLTKLSLPGGDYVLANTRDISERKRIQRQLQAEEQRSRALSESSPVGMVVIDGSSEFGFKYLNPTFAELFGCDLRDTPTMQSWLARVYPDQAVRREATSKWIGILKATGSGPDKSFVRKLNSKGNLQKYIRFVPVQLQTGEILMTCWDITSNRLAERRIKERNLVLEVLNEVMSSVTGSLHLSEILQSLERVFVRKLKITAGGIFFNSETDNSSSKEVRWGVPPSGRHDLKALVLKCFGGGEVIHKGDVTLVRHEPNRSSPEIAATLKRYGWRSYLCISLLAKGEAPGMIFLAHRRRDAFNDDQVAFYRALGQQIGVAMQNAHLFEQVRQSHAEMKALSLRLVRAQEEQLRYVGRELHDEIGQLLTGLGLAIEMAMQSTGGPATNLLEVKSLANTITSFVRELSRKLRPSMLDDLGLLPTLPWLFERFSSHTNIQVVFEHMLADNKRFSPEVETAIYRIVQEALTNVARHAKVNCVTVRLWSNEETLGVQIEDRGIGFDFHSVVKSESTNGVTGMRERVLLLGGRFTIETHPGNGTRLTAELPKK